MPRTDNLLHPVPLGRMTLAGNLVLAPMHQHTHRSLRLLARRAGATLAHTEMVTPEDLLAGGRKAENILASAPEDRPLGVQLLPRDAAPLREAVAMVAGQAAADLVDLNFACPSRRVVACGRGGAMLKKPRTAGRLVAAAVAAAGPLPVTIKMRIGWTAGRTDRRRALAIACEAVAAGAAGITLHARTVDQGYGGRADWAAIEAWVEEFSSTPSTSATPIFGSGDLRSPEAVLEMLRVTRAAGASIARGALGAPWIFRQAIALAARGAYAPVTMRERRETVLAHYDGLEHQYGEAASVRLMRRLATYYARGLPRAAEARAAFQAVRTAAEFRETVGRWLSDEEPLAGARG